MARAFSVIESLRSGWDVLRAHSALAFQLMLSVFALQVALSVVRHSIGKEFIGTLAMLALTVLGLFVGVGVTHISLKLSRGRSAAYREILPDASMVWRFFAAGILAAGMAVLPLVAGGLLGWGIAFVSVGRMPFVSADIYVLGSAAIAGLCVAALVMAAGVASAVYIGLRYSLVRFAVLDGAGILQSLRKSAHYTRGAKGSLLLFFLAVGVLNIIGFALFAVGLLVTIPVSMFAYARVYDLLKSFH